MPRPTSGPAVLVALALLMSAHVHGQTLARQLLDEGGAQDSIVNGVDAPRRYPWMVSIRLNSDLGFHNCGGTLIAPCIVLTAAHCVINEVTGQILTDAWNPYVVIGGYDLKGPSPPGYPWAGGPPDADVRRVIKTVPHPKFGYLYRNTTKEQYWFNYDVALLYLALPSRKQTIRLPSYMQKPRLPVQPGRNVTLIGWGWTEVRDGPPYAVPNILQQTTQPMLPLRTCTEKLGVFTGTMDVNFSSPTNTMICAGTPNEFSNAACKGDSGGPLFLPRNATGSDTDATQVGVFSWLSLSCVYFPGAWTNLAQLRPWIDKTVRELEKFNATGRVFGDPWVAGFDGKRFKYPGKPGSSIKILTSAKFNITGTLKALRRASGLNSTALASVSYSRKDLVRVVAGDEGMAVWLNGRRVPAGTTRQMWEGTLQVVARWDAAIIRQPGLVIRVTQPERPCTPRPPRPAPQAASGCQSALAAYLDVRVTLTKVPPFKLGGLLGATYDPNAPWTVAAPTAGGRGTAEGRTAALSL